MRLLARQCPIELFSVVGRDFVDVDSFFPDLRVNRQSSPNDDDCLVLSGNQCCRVARSCHRQFRRSAKPDRHGFDIAWCQASFIFEKLQVGLRFRSCQQGASMGESESSRTRTLMTTSVSAGSQATLSALAFAAG
jgi:hypothetical protein